MTITWAERQAALRQPRAAHPPIDGAEDLLYPTPRPPPDEPEQPETDAKRGLSSGRLGPWSVEDGEGGAA